MVVFDEILSDLLMQNNCVVIPALGGFVANTVSAKVDVDKGIITPPSKALSFNRSLTNNDGLLVSALSQQQSISYDEANEKISTNVLKIKSRLNEGERVHFQNVGFLYLNDAGKMAFEQDRFFNLLLASYGMGNVQFVPVEEEKETPAVHEELDNKEELEQTKVTPATSDKENDTKVIELKPSAKDEPKKPVQPIKKTSTLKKVVKYAAAAALIPVAFYSFWIPMKTDVLQSGIVYTEDFNPFAEKSKAKYVEGISKDPIKPEEVRIENELDKITSHLVANNGDLFSYPLTEDDYVTVRFNKPVANTNKEINQSNTNGYHLIVGCFREHENAKNMIQQLNSAGWQGVIVDKHKGLHRVSAAVSQNKSEILKKRSLIKNEGFNAWVLLK